MMSTEDLLDVLDRMREQIESGAATGGSLVYTVSTYDDSEDPPVVTYDVERGPEASPLGWTQGVVDASARMIGVVAAEFGPDHPVVDRMAVRAADLVEATLIGDRVETGDDPDDGAP